MNYPAWGLFHDMFGFKRSFNDLANVLRAEKAQFGNVNVLGSFIDNHYHDRFQSFAMHVRMQNCLAYAFSTAGIPIMYYGTEQSFSGKLEDHNNTQPLWTSHLNTSSEMYQWVKTLNKARQETKWWAYEMEIVWSDELFFAMRRGTTLMAFSNDYNAG